MRWDNLTPISRITFCQLKSFFWHNISWHLENGSNIRFWADKWLGNNTIKSMFPIVTGLALDPYFPIKEQGYFDNGEWKWHLLIRRSSANSTSEKSSLLQAISEFSILTDTTDTPKWTLQNSGVFTVSTCYKFLSSRGVSSPRSHIIWNSIAPLKVKIFMWLLLEKQVAHQNTNYKEKWAGDAIYIFCNNAPESRNHLFLLWSFALFIGFFSSPTLPTSLLLEVFTVNQKIFKPAWDTVAIAMC